MSFMSDFIVSNLLFNVTFHMISECTKDDNAAKQKRIFSNILFSNIRITLVTLVPVHQKCTYFFWQTDANLT